MTFTARIRRHSFTWQAWVRTNRISGVVGDVLFRWVRGGDFVSGPLAPLQIDALRLFDDVQLEGAEMAPVVAPPQAPLLPPAPAAPTTLTLPPRPPPNKPGPNKMGLR